MKCIICRGNPGQGKSTFIRTVFPNVFHIENDMWHVRDGKYAFDVRKQDYAISWCADMCERALSEGMDCAVSNTFTKFKYVDVYRRIAEQYKAEFSVYRMRGEFKNVHDVPNAVLNNMRRNFEDWPGEINVYPNLNQDREDPCYRPYMLTELKIGDMISVMRFADGKDTHRLEISASGKTIGDSFETEQCIATVTDIRQGTYDYLNVSYIENDTGKSGICMGGDCRKMV